MRKMHREPMSPRMSHQYSWPTLSGTRSQLLYHRPVTHCAVSVSVLSSVIGRAVCCSVSVHKQDRSIFYHFALWNAPAEFTQSLEGGGRRFPASQNFPNSRTQREEKKTTTIAREDHLLLSMFFLQCKFYANIIFLILFKKQTFAELYIALQHNV